MYKQRDGKAIIKRLTDEMEKEGLDVLILKSPGALTYGTGYLCTGGLASGSIAVVTKDGNVNFIVSEFQKQAVLEVVDDSVNVEAYPIWIYIEDFASEGMKKDVQPDPFKIFKLAMEFIPSKPDIKIGLEPMFFDYFQYNFLIENYGLKSLTDATQLLIEAHAIKTPWEINVLRRNAKATEIAMNQTAKDIVPGMTTKDVYSIFTKRCYEQLPSSYSIGHAHTIGPNYSPTTVPSDYRINRGDLIRLDGGCIADAYPSDLGRTYAIGGYASEDKIELYGKLWKGYEFAIKNIGPGVKMSDIFYGVEKAIGLDGYIRGHFGHSLGVLGDENYPFIAPQEHRTFEPGMIFCFETPFYSSKRHTYNIEDSLLITDNGIELFTEASPSIFL